MLRWNASIIRAVKMLAVGCNSHARYLCMHAWIVSLMRPGVARYHCRAARGLGALVQYMTQLTYSIAATLRPVAGAC
jgi:hypothetical protein